MMPPATGRSAHQHIHPTTTQLTHNKVLVTTKIEPVYPKFTADPLWLCVLQDEFDMHKRYIKPQPTGATQGHALGAQQRTLAAAASSSGGSRQWKMKRFESKARPKITKYMYSESVGSGACEMQPQEEEQQQQQDC